MSAIPVIDFQKYGLQVSDPDSVSRDDLQDLGNQICKALEEIGFFYLKNHGLPDEKIQEMMYTAKEFFSQPLEEKKKYAVQKGTIHGYLGLETEQNNQDRPFEYKEAYNINYGCDIWPTYPQDFESIQKKFLETCKELAFRVFDVMSVGLDLKDRYFLREYHKTIGKAENITTLRTLYYPATSTNKDPKEGQIACGEHSDYGSLTLLFQDLFGGLEVRNRNGEYIPATPVQGTIVVNIGDILERWTANRLIATKHRVIMPPSAQERQSIAAFMVPDPDAVIKCLDGSDKYPPIRCNDFIFQNFYKNFNK